MFSLQDSSSQNKPQSNFIPFLPYTFESLKRGERVELG
jgi:hypothetical protein